MLSFPLTLDASLPSASGRSSTTTFRATSWTSARPDNASSWANISTEHTDRPLPDSPLIGVISDTHGLLRPEAINALGGADLIVHAGDVGNLGILDALRAIAPVFAIRGNVDGGEWARDLPKTEVVEVDAVKLYIIHDVNELDLSPETARFDAVISGHSHSPSVVKRNGVLFLNPGSAGPRRFKLPVTIARIQVRGESLEAQLVELDLEATPSRSY